MTIPLIISNADRIELRNIMKHLEVGRKAKFDGLEGTIEFVSDEYITICVREIPDESFRTGVRQVNVIVMQSDWDDLEIEDSHFKNVKNYRGKTNDHPGNEMLPPIKKR